MLFEGTPTVSHDTPVPAPHASVVAARRKKGLTIPQRHTPTRRTTSLDGRLSFFPSRWADEHKWSVVRLVLFWICLSPRFRSYAHEIPVWVGRMDPTRSSPPHAGEMGRAPRCCSLFAHQWSPSPPRPSETWRVPAAGAASIAVRRHTRASNVEPTGKKTVWQDTIGRGHSFPMPWSWRDPQRPANGRERKAWHGCHADPHPWGRSPRTSAGHREGVVPPPHWTHLSHVHALRKDHAEEGAWQRVVWIQRKTTSWPWLSPASTALFPFCFSPLEDAYVRRRPQKRTSMAEVMRFFRLSKAYRRGCGKR